MMVRQDRTYYVFFTGGGLQIITSTNMMTWHYAGTVFDTIPSWVPDAVGPLTDLWAPDVTYFNGLYHLYFAGSQFGTNTSVIGLATTPTLDPRSPKYHWTDDGLVFRTTSADNFNAIDPSLVTAADGGKWLVLGSFFSGIKMIQLDAATGKPAASPTRSAWRAQ